MDPVRQIAQTVLYEGYLLWPYRRSAQKNQQRWTFGGLFPEPYSAASGNGDPALSRTECLIEAGPTARLDVEVRFLHLVTRQVGTAAGTGFVSVPELTVGAQRHLAGEETIERAVNVTDLLLDDLRVAPHRLDVTHPAEQAVEELTDPAGLPAALVVRSWQTLCGRVETSAERVSKEHHRITVQVRNTTPWSGGSRTEAVHRALLSAHVVLRAEDARFVSLTDPPDDLRQLTAGCRNVGVWPVLVGTPGDRHTVLSAPIILYDYPQIAPESPGDLFDGTEIDQLLTLSVLALTEEEQREARDTDPRARELLDRCAALSPAQLLRLGGTLREVCRSPSAPAGEAG